MRNSIYYIVVALVFLISKSTIAQDIHFSQFQFAQTYLNPATTGTFKGDYRAVLNFKEQFSEFDNAFQTYRASYDMPISKTRRGLKQTGAGIDIYQDIAGDSKTKITTFLLNISQTVQLSYKSDLSLGLGFGYSQYSANYNNLKWDDQYNGIAYDENSLTQENFLGRSQGIFEISTGLLFRQFDRNGKKLEVGVSLAHLTTPQLELNGTGLKDNLPMRFVLHGKKEFELNDEKWGVIPMLFFANQRRAREIMIGSMFSYKYSLRSQYTGYYKSTRVYFGANIRVGDAIIPQFGLNIKERYIFNVSYDINVSKARNASQYKGGLEVSLSLSGFFNSKFQVISPATF